MFLAPIAFAFAFAAPQTIFEIGQPDGDYKEFAIAGHYEQWPEKFNDSQIFDTENSVAKEAWPYVHPGPEDAWAGSRKHQIRIRFRLKEIPPEACRLAIRFVNTHYGDPPAFEIAVNAEHKYQFETPAGGGDDSLRDPRAGKPCAISLPFPSTNLKLGYNIISITSVRGSWALYDSVILQAGVPAPSGPEVGGFQATSTMFFKGVGGELKQAVLATIQNTGLEGDAEVSIGTTSQTVKLNPGANSVYILVPPFDKTAPAKLTVRTKAGEQSVEFEGKRERQWKVYVAPSAHTDIGYTDLQDNAMKRHADNTEAAMRACASDPLFKWNLEVTAQSTFLKLLHPDDYPKLMSLIKDGRLGLQGMYLNMLTGLCSGEELAEVFLRGQRIADANGFKVESAAVNDVPSTVGTLPMMMRQAGIKYFSEAVNQDRGPLFRDADRRFIQSPLWWEGLDGSRVLAVFANGYAQAAGFGFADDVGTVRTRLLGWLKGYDRDDYPANAVLIYGGFSDNQPINPRYAKVIEEWNAEWEYPKIVAARHDEFFRYVDEHFGDKLPVFKGDLGAYWEDGAGSSAKETAMVRWGRTRLERAMRRDALAAALGMEAFPWPAAQAAYEDILFYDEHTWGAWCSISEPNSEQTVKQWEFKAAYAERAAAECSKLDGTAEGGGLNIFNDQSWPRDMLVTVPATPGQRVKGSRCQRSGDKLVFLAKKVPPMGSASYALEPGEPAGTPLLTKGADDFTWKTPDFTVVISPRGGAILRLEDHKLKRNWVHETSGYGLNQYVYVAGGDGTGMIHPGGSLANLDFSTHRSATVTLVENGPMRGVLKVARTGEGVSPCDTYLIFRPDRGLDIVNVLHKEAMTAKEAGYFVFPFNLGKPGKAFVELPYGWVEADTEQVPSACRDWYSAVSYGAVSDGQWSAYVATPSAPLLCVNDVNRGKWLSKIGRSNGVLFSYALNNYWHTNYKASQGGDLVFAYSLDFAKGDFDPVRATQFGWDRLEWAPDPRAGSSPDVWMGSVSGQDGRGAGPLLTLDKGPVVIGALRFERGRLVVRLYNPSRKSATTAIGMPGGAIRNAWQTDLAGRNGIELPVTNGKRMVTVPARGIATVEIETASK